MPKTSSPDSADASGRLLAGDIETPWAAPLAGAPPLEIAPGLWWARQTLTSRLNHVNQWLLEDQGGLTLVDTGVDRPETRAWWMARLPALGGLARVLVTHHHYDHLGGAHFLCEKYGAPLWMTRTEWMSALTRARRWTMDQDRVRRLHFLSNGLREGDIDRIQGHFSAFNERLPPTPGAFVRIAAGDRLRIGSRGWTVLTGEGHAPEQVMLFCEADRILISADQVLPSITPHIGVWADEPEADPLGLYLRSLERLEKLPEDTLVLPSHGVPFRGLQSRLAALRAHHERRLDQTLEACIKGASAAEIMRALFPPARDVQDLALGFSEALAHAHLLRNEGWLRSEATSDGLRRFRKASRP